MKSTSPEQFIAALEELVKSTHEQGLGPDEVMAIIGDLGQGGEEGIKIIVDDLFLKLQK